MIVVGRTDMIGHFGEDFRRKPRKEDGTPRSSAEAGKQLFHRFERFAFAEHCFRKADACGARVIEQYAVIHDCSS